MSRVDFEISGVRFLTNGKHSDLPEIKGPFSLRRKIRKFYEDNSGLECTHFALSPDGSGIYFYSAKEEFEKKIFSAAYSIRSVFKDGDKKNWFITVPLSNNQFYVVAYLAGAPIVGTDTVLDTEETKKIVAELRKAIPQWDGDFVASDIEESGKLESLDLTGAFSSKGRLAKIKQAGKLHPYRYVPPLLSMRVLVAMAAMIFFICILSAFYFYNQMRMEEIRKEHLRKEALKIFREKTGSKKTVINTLKGPWLEMPLPSKLYQACIGALPENIISVAGWKFNSFDCTWNESGSTLQITFLKGDAFFSALKKELPGIASAGEGKVSLRIGVPTISVADSNPELLGKNFYTENFRELLNYLGYKTSPQFLPYEMTLYSDGSIETAAPMAEEEKGDGKKIQKEKTTIEKLSYEKSTLNMDQVGTKPEYVSFLKVLDVVPGVKLKRFSMTIEGLIKYELEIYADSKN